MKECCDGGAAGVVGCVVGKGAGLLGWCWVGVDLFGWGSVDVWGICIDALVVLEGGSGCEY